MTALDEWRAVPPAARRAVEERLRRSAVCLREVGEADDDPDAHREATDIDAAIAALQAVADGGA